MTTARGGGFAMFEPGRHVAPRLNRIDSLVRYIRVGIYSLVLELDKIYFVLFAVSPHCLVATTARGSGLIL